MADAGQMRAAVTGANGFIGRLLVARLLQAGWQVNALSRTGEVPSGTTGFAAVLGETGSDDLRAFVDQADVLFHCAGEIRDRERMQSTHVDGVVDLLATAKGRVERWVHLSSVGAYGPIRDGRIDENHSQHPIGLYEETKARSDELVLAAHARGDILGVVLRPSIVFATQMPNPSLRQMARLIERNLFFLVGKPGASANYVHADDVVEALMVCGSARDAGGVYNLSDWTTMENFSAAMAEGLGLPAPTRRLPESVVRLVATLAQGAPGMPLTPARVDALTNRSHYATDRIEALGFRPRRPLEEAVSAVASDWRTS